jgi:hypothetical protein
MAIRLTPALKNYHSYPVIMVDGSIKELCHVDNRFFTLQAIEVSEHVSYKIFQLCASRAKL